MIRRPGFAAVAILSLALGIGGNTAVFGIVDSFVLHPFAFPDANRLLVIGPVFPKLSSETQFIEVLSPLEYEDIRRARSFAGTAAFDLGNRNISGGDVPDRVFTAFTIDERFRSRTRPSRAEGTSKRSVSNFARAAHSTTAIAPAHRASSW